MVAKIKVETAEVDIDIYQGSNFDETFSYQDTESIPIDLTGYTARMSIKNALTNELIDSLTTANSGIILGGAAGTIRINIVDTASYNFDRATYDLELIDPSSKVSKLMAGKITLIREVTT